MSDTIIGIDLGTTNSEVAIVKNGQATVLEVSDDKFILPSVVAISEGSKLLVGEQAKNQRIAFPENTITSVKRQMGTDETVILAGKSYTPQEISSIILKKLKEIAETSLGHSVEKAVITVPAYFSDKQRLATKEAGQIAGLDVVRMINEPTAAALAYEVHGDNEKKVLVYDLGGGTFDVSIVSVSSQITEVLSSHGNNQLGGDDFDNKLKEHIISHIKDLHDVDITTDIKAMGRISHASEIAKIKLSDSPYAKIEEEFIAKKNDEPIHLSLEISREEYEALIEPLIDETFEAVQIALTDANLTISDIDEVVLVGGSTKTPVVSERFEKELGIYPKSNIHPDLCVAMGAAIQGAVIAGQKVSAVLIDVTPYTFGTSALGIVDGMPTNSLYCPIIKKNTPIPVTKSESFFTASDYQPRVEIKIFQGEDPDADNNIEIGNFTVSGLSKVPSGNPIVLNLHLDLNGILKVTAVEKNTGLEKSVTIDNAISRFEQDAINQAKERISGLLENTNEQTTSVSSNLSTHAKELIEKARGYLDDASDEDKEDIINLIESLSDAIGNQDEPALQEHMESLNDILYYLEDSLVNE